MSDGHGYSTSGFGIDRDSSARLIVKTALEEGVTDPHQIAYMLATAQHETRNFTAPEEDFGRQQAQKLGYRGGEDYFGRGYVHLTHIENYQRFDHLLGLNGQLLQHKELAEKPEIAAKILVIGMRDGEFTSRRLDRYVNGDQHDYVNARRVVNSTDKADLIAGYAAAWDQRVPAIIQDVKANGVQIHPTSNPSGADEYLAKGAHGAEVLQLQTHLHQLGFKDQQGHALGVDSDFGANTDFAVKAFQAEHRLPVDGKVGEQTLNALLQSELHQLGYKDAHGQPLAIDGNVGANTRFALGAFQRDHQLPVTGHVDTKTQASIDQSLTHAGQRQAAAAPDDPRNPDHALYQQALAGVQKIDTDMGRTSDQLSKNLAASLAAEAKRQGLTHIDKVAMSADGSRTFAAQDVHGSLRHADVMTAAAVHTSVQQSSTAAQAPATAAQTTADPQHALPPQAPTQPQANHPQMA